MKVEIKEGMSQAEIEKELAKLEKTEKKADLKKYVGKVDLGMDGLAWQEKMRNEWD